jgi:hypothetical protein
MSYPTNQDSTKVELKFLKLRFFISVLHESHLLVILLKTDTSYKGMSSLSEKVRLGEGGDEDF